MLIFKLKLMMKKYILYFLVLSLGIFFCLDFLEEENFFNVMVESFYVIVDGFELFINVNYVKFCDIYGDYVYMFCLGIDLYVFGCFLEFDGLSQYCDLGFFVEGVEYIYNICYSVIQVVNQVLYYVDLME